MVVMYCIMFVCNYNDSSVCNMNSYLVNTASLLDTYLWNSNNTTSFIIIFPIQLFNGPQIQEDSLGMLHHISSYLKEKIKIATNKAMNSAFVKKCTTSINNFVSYTYSVQFSDFTHFQFGKVAGIITWMLAATLCVTVVPLFLEVHFNSRNHFQIDREQIAIEAENRQIQKLRQRGYTSHQISMLQAQSTIPVQ